MKVLLIILISICITYSQNNLNTNPKLFNYNGNTNKILTENGMGISGNPFIIVWQWGGDHRLFNIVILSEAKNPVEISLSLSGAEMNIVFFWNLIF